MHSGHKVNEKNVDGKSVDRQNVEKTSMDKTSISLRRHIIVFVHTLCYEFHEL